VSTGRKRSRSQSPTGQWAINKEIPVVVWAMDNGDTVITILEFKYHTGVKHIINGLFRIIQ